MKNLLIIIIALLTIGSIDAQLVVDTRNTNEPPTFYNREVKYEFKKRGVLGAPGTGYYSGLMTFAPWADNSGGKHHQLNFNNGGVFYRTGYPNSSTWEPWSQFLMAGNTELNLSTNFKLAGNYGAELRRGVYPFKMFWYYEDDGTGYGPAWIHKNRKGTTHPTMFLQTRGNAAELRVNDVISLGKMEVSLGSYPTFQTKVQISGNPAKSSYINNGKGLAIGAATVDPGFMLTVAGHISTREVRVFTGAGADFVFEEDYELPPLSEVEKFVTKNKHLKEIAPAKDMVENGVLIGDMNIKLLQKVEELTLYTIQQEKEIQALKKSQKSVDEMMKQLQLLKKEIKSLKAKE